MIATLWRHRPFLLGAVFCLASFLLIIYQVGITQASGDSEVPGPVGSLELATNGEMTKIKVRWTAPEDGGDVEFYRVRVRKVDGGKMVLKSKLVPAGGKLATVFKKMDFDEEYEVRIAGKNAAGRGEWVKATICLCVEVDWRPLNDDEWEERKENQ